MHQEETFELPKSKQLKKGLRKCVSYVITTIYLIYLLIQNEFLSIPGVV